MCGLGVDVCGGAFLVLFLVFFSLSETRVQVFVCCCGFPVVVPVPLRGLRQMCIGGRLWMVFGLGMAWGTKSYAICF